MSSKLLFVALIAFSVSCFGQAVSTGGYATNAAPMSTISTSTATAPMVATPDAALPGSGPAVGVPLGNSNSNDSRVSTGPSVYNPNAVGYEYGANAEPAPIGASNTNTTPATNQPFEFGVQHVISSSPDVNSPTPSLGDIARRVRSNRNAPVRVINNDSIARLNAQAGTGNRQNPSTVATTIRPANGAAQPTADCGALMAKNQTPALPQSDQEEAAAPVQPCPK
jgi:hypothetical protein